MQGAPILSRGASPPRTPRRRRSRGPHDPRSAPPAHSLPLVRAVLNQTGLVTTNPTLSRSRLRRARSARVAHAISRSLAIQANVPRRSLWKYAAAVSAASLSHTCFVSCRKRIARPNLAAENSRSQESQERWTRLALHSTDERAQLSAQREWRSLGPVRRASQHGRDSSGVELNVGARQTIGLRSVVAADAVLHCSHGALDPSPFHDHEPSAA